MLWIPARLWQHLITFSRNIESIISKGQYFCNWKSTRENFLGRRIMVVIWHGWTQISEYLYETAIEMRVAKWRRYFHNYGRIFVGDKWIQDKELIRLIPEWETYFIECSIRCHDTQLYIDNHSTAAWPRCIIPNPFKILFCCWFGP